MTTETKLASIHWSVWTLSAILALMLAALTFSLGDDVHKLDTKLDHIDNKLNAIETQLGISQ